MGNEADQLKRSMASARPSTAAQRRERNREEMRNLILGAARRLLNEHGPQAISMRAVAAEIGYSPAAIYEYFASKDRLLEGLFFEGTEGLAGRMREAVERQPPGSSALDRITAAGAAYRAYALEHPDLYRLIFSTPIPPERAEPLEADEGFRFLVESFRSGIESGALNEGDPFEGAIAAWALVHGFVMLEIQGALPNEPPGIRDKLFDSVRHWFQQGSLRHQ